MFGLVSLLTHIDESEMTNTVCTYFSGDLVAVITEEEIETAFEMEKFDESEECEKPDDNQ